VSGLSSHFAFLGRLFKFLNLIHAFPPSGPWFYFTWLTMLYYRTKKPNCSNQLVSSYQWSMRYRAKLFVITLLIWLSVYNILKCQHSFLCTTGQQVSSWRHSINQGRKCWKQQVLCVCTLPQRRQEGIVGPQALWVLPPLLQQFHVTLPVSSTGNWSLILSTMSSKLFLISN
jgi:hypothetical protein